MSTSSSSTSGGIGVLGLLLAAFVFCKLAEVTAIATWSWFWVLTPMWLPLAVLAAVFLVMGVVLVVVASASGIAKLFRGKSGGDKWARKAADMAAQDRGSPFGGGLR